MSQNTKIILAIAIGVLVVLCMCMCVLVLVGSSLFITNSGTVSTGSVRSVVEEAVQVEPGALEFGGDASVPFALPAGWHSDYAMRIGGYRLVGYRPASGQGHILLAVVPETEHTNIDEIEREIRGITGGHGYRWNDAKMTVVDRRPITIADRPAEMVVSEGAGSSGPWRQAMVTFRSERGLMLVIYGMPTAAYDQAEADALFASIR